LHEKGLPCCTVEEIPSYVYSQGEHGKLDTERTDPSCADHGCDALRYAVSFLHRRDMTPDQESRKGPVTTWADVLGHREVWEKST
jgi:hypothetical protein